MGQSERMLILNQEEERDGIWLWENHKAVYFNLAKNAVNRVKPMWKADLHPESLYSSMFQSGEGGECRI